MAGARSTVKLSLRPSFNWLLHFPITLALEHAGGMPAPLVFFSAALSIVPIASLIVQLHRAARDLHRRRRRRAAQRHLRQRARADHRPRRAARRAARHGARLVRRRHPRQPAARARRCVSPRRPAPPQPDLQRRRRAPVRLDDADRRLQPDGAERVQPLPLARRDGARRRCSSTSGLAVVLLAAYALYLVFMLKTHPDEFAATAGHETHGEHGPRWSLARAVGSLRRRFRSRHG